MVALMMLSTALKDIAVELGLFVMSSTQTNAKSDDDNRTMKNESVIRGARSIIDKCDLACVISRVTKEEEELLNDTIQKIGITPNQVMDVYKVRRGKYTNVRIWSYVDLGTCRKLDLFITDEKLNEVPGFEIMEFDFDERMNSDKITAFLSALNEEIETGAPVQKIEEETIDNLPEVTVEQIEIDEQRKKGFFGDLM